MVSNKFIGLMTLLAACLGLLVSDSVQAAGEAVAVDGVVLSRCGTHQVPITGTATYSEYPHLVVTVDGVVRLHSHAGTALWSAGLIPLSPGQHTATATIFTDSDQSHGSVAATHSQVFTVSSCGGGGGDEKDCCPGKDPEEPKQPKVLGATTAGEEQVDPDIHTLKAEVYNISDDRIEVKYAKPDGTLVYRNFHITEITQIRGHIRIGSQVKITFPKNSQVALKIEDTSPAGMENVWGAVNRSDLYG